MSQRSVTSAQLPKANVEASWGHDLHHVDNNQPSRVSRISRNNPLTHITRNNRLFEAITAKVSQTEPSDQVNAKKLGEEITIRGLAGPYVVVGTNFASGTTAADIESAMVPSGGEMQTCRIIASEPTVVAEMVFAEKANAERVIATFNNKRVRRHLLNSSCPADAPDIGRWPYTSPLHEARRPDEPYCHSNSSSEHS